VDWLLAGLDKGVLRRENTDPNGATGLNARFDYSYSLRTEDETSSSLLLPTHRLITPIATTEPLRWILLPSSALGGRYRSATRARQTA